MIRQGAVGAIRCSACIDQRSLNAGLSYIPNIAASGLCSGTVNHRNRAVLSLNINRTRTGCNNVPACRLYQVAVSNHRDIARSRQNVRIRRQIHIGRPAGAVRLNQHVAAAVRIDSDAACWTLALLNRDRTVYRSQNDRPIGDTHQIALCSIVSNRACCRRVQDHLLNRNLIDCINFNIRHFHQVDPAAARHRRRSLNLDLNRIRRSRAQLTHTGHRTEACLLRVNVYSLILARVVRDYACLRNHVHKAPVALVGQCSACPVVGSTRIQAPKLNVRLRNIADVPTHCKGISAAVH